MAIGTAIAVGSQILGGILEVEVQRKQLVKEKLQLEMLTDSSEILLKYLVNSTETLVFTEIRQCLLF